MHPESGQSAIATIAKRCFKVIDNLDPQTRVNFILRRTAGVWLVPICGPRLEPRLLSFREAALKSGSSSGTAHYMHDADTVFEQTVSIEGGTLKRPVDSCDQRFRREWLVKISDTPGIERFAFERLVVHRCNEDDGKRNAYVLQPMPELDPRHTAEMDIKDDTADQACLCLAEKRFSR